ncbi:DNA-binding protein [Enterobacter sp. PTB]|uniref:DNA-binding protein n=1 Tax=Enterobacter sp. PTB TaxID=3143437 RepID=UPI003DA7D6EE
MFLSVNEMIGLPGVPGTAQGVRHLLNKAAGDMVELKRKREGTKAFEYHIDCLPAAPVVPDGLRLALSNAGIATPESDELLFATHEKYVQMLVTWVKDRKPFQPAPAATQQGVKS